MVERILMVVTSHSTLGTSGQATGFWLEKLSVPLAVFRGCGFQVEVASLAGGAAPVDPASVAADTSNVPDLGDIVAGTMPIAEVDSSRYDGLFLVGGHGTMWDFADNDSLARVVAGIAPRGVIGAICRGVAGLLGGGRLARDFEQGAGRLLDTLVHLGDTDLPRTSSPTPPAERRTPSTVCAMTSTDSDRNLGIGAGGACD